MKKIIVFLLLMTGTAFAQDDDRTALLEKAVSILQSQRDEANNKYVNSEAYAQHLKEMVNKLKAENVELKKQTEPKQ